MCETGHVANISATCDHPLDDCLLRFVNLLKSEETCKQIILVDDGPAAGKAVF